MAFARVLLIAACSVFLLQATGFSRAAETECRDDDCGGDDGGQCPSACVCSCCAHAMPIVVTTVTLSPPPGMLQISPSVDQPTPPSADPHEILHVPKIARL